MNITVPDKNSDVYKQYVELINHKVSSAISWLIDRKIEYIWNNQIEGHLYRIYIPSKDVLLDFEPYPVNNINYNWIRINYDTDIIRVLEHLFPETILDTQELDVWKLNRRAANRFLRENEVSPIYDENVLRLALVKDHTIYQCVIVKDNKIIANATKRNFSVPYGTYILLRYLNEQFGISEIFIKETLDNSYTNMIYQILNLPVVSKSSKKRIWWNEDKTEWHIKRELTSQFIPFYLCESVVYRYSGN
jgi:hypothetical protein